MLHVSLWSRQSRRHNLLIEGVFPFGVGLQAHSRSSITSPSPGPKQVGPPISSHHPVDFLSAVPPECSPGPFSHHPDFSTSASSHRCRGISFARAARIIQVFPHPLHHRSLGSATTCAPLHHPGFCTSAASTSSMVLASSRFLHIRFVAAFIGPLARAVSSHHPGFCTSASSRSAETARCAT